MLQKKGSPAGSSKKFPCRGGESIRRRSTPTLSNRRLDSPPFLSSSPRLAVPLSLFFFPPSETRFERIIIGGTRAHGLSSRERSPLFLLIPDLFRASPTALPGRLSYSSPPGSLILGRNLDLYTVNLLVSYTRARPHAGGATRYPITIRFSC